MRDVRSPPVAGVLNGAGGRRPCLKHASLAAIKNILLYNYDFSGVFTRVTVTPVLRGLARGARGGSSGDLLLEQCIKRTSRRTGTQAWVKLYYRTS